jgi:CHAT domain-containing protein/Tfp pilus assembly protein PilF
MTPYLFRHLQITLLIFGLTLSAFANHHFQTADEDAIHTLINRYFAAYAKEDLEAITDLWSNKSPDLSAHRKTLERLFADNDHIEVNGLSVRWLKIDGAAAQARVSLAISAVEAKTGRPAGGFGRRNRSFQFEKEAGAWKIRREESSETELAAKLVSAKKEDERAALLDAHQELLNSQLSDSLHAQGLSFIDRGNYPDGLLSMQLSRTVAERINDTKGIVAAMVGTGNVYQARGDFPAALEIYQQAQKFAEANGDDAALASILNNLCTVQQRLGNFDQATEHCQRSLAIAEAAGNKVSVASTFNNLGIIARQRGNYEQALAFYHKGLALEEELGNKRNVARLLNNLGVANNAMGNATAALRYYLRSLTIAEEIGNKAGIASTLNNISMIYRNLGNYKLALEYSERSFALSEAIGDKTTVSMALEELGKLHARAGEHDQALECYRKSLALSEQSGQKLEIAIRLLSVGNGYRNLGNSSQAIDYYQRGLALAESVGVPYTVIAFQITLSRLYLQQGRFSEALEISERAVARARQLGSHADFWQALLIAGVAFHSLKQPESARQRLEEAIKIIESARSQLTASERDQASFFETRFDPYIQMVMLAAGQGQMAEAFSFAERAKARVLLDVLQVGKVDINKAMSQPEREQEIRLRAELNSLNGQLRRESQALKSDPSRLEELKAKVEKARLTYEDFQGQLYVAHPELKIKRGQVQPLALEQAGELLTDAKTALLEYAVTNDKTFLFVITANTETQKGQPQPVLKVYELKITRQDLTGRVQKLNQRIANNDLDYAQLSSELYNLLLAPAQKQLQGKTRLVIVPDDILWETPFQALRSAEGRFLIQSTAIAYAPSLTVLREISKSRKPQTAPTLMAFGNPKLIGQTLGSTKNMPMNASVAPLPDAERLVKELAQVYGAKTSKIYVGAEAREEVLKAEANKYRILQLATHGVINNASPMYSHVVLAHSEDDREDGLLEAWEILQMDLQADLAVLSACETARGKIGAGEGVIGLSWALFVAGCPTTVVSQWKVESSSTTELMLTFHRGLQKGATKSEALRQAAMKLMANKKYNHPFYWAGFIVVGDGN